MDISINKNGEEYIHNLAFIKAICIQEYIEGMNVTQKEKEEIKKDVLNLLQKTWMYPKQELEWHKLD